MKAVGDTMITLSKIAKLSNVSVSTASKAFAGSPEVNEETRNLIFDIAKKNKCFKKFYNMKYPKLVMALIAPEFQSALYAKYLFFIQKMMEEKNGELCVSTTNFSPEKEKDLIEYYYKHSNVDGIIVINARTDMPEKYEIPVVFVNPSIEPVYAVSVISDMKPAVSKSIDYLIQKNVDSIGFIGEKLTLSKLELFKQSLKEKGVTPNEAYFEISDARFEAGGYSAMEAMLSKQPRPRAIVCAYDHMAIGAIRCIYDHGLSVPQDIAVLGMDDISEAPFLNPPLASISTNTEDLCRVVTETMMKQIHDENPVQPQRMASEFHLRRSFEIV